MKTTTQIKDQIVRKGASELVHSILESGVFFDTEDSLRGWAQELFDTNMLGQSPSNAEYDEVLEIMMCEVNDRVYEFFQQAQSAIFEKAFLVQKSLDHDTSL
jgi:hypothetical protein